MNLQLKQSQVDWLKSLVALQPGDGSGMKEVTLHRLEEVTFTPGVVYFKDDLFRMPLKVKDGKVWFCAADKDKRLMVIPCPEDEFNEWVKGAKTVEFMTFLGSETLVWEGL